MLFLKTYTFGPSVPTQAELAAPPRRVMTSHRLMLDIQLPRALGGWFTLSLPQSWDWVLGADLKWVFGSRRCRTICRPTISNRSTSVLLKN